MTLAFIFESVGFGEWFVLLAVILVVVGPKRLPETARKFGQYYSKFRRAAESFKRQIMDMETEISRVTDDFEKAVDEAADSVETATNDFQPFDPESGDVSENGESIQSDSSYGEVANEEPSQEDRVQAEEPVKKFEPIKVLDPIKTPEVEKAPYKITVNALSEKKA